MKGLRGLVWLLVAALLAACLAVAPVQAAIFSVRLEPLSPTYSVTHRLGGSIGPDDPLAQWVIDVAAEVSSLELKVSTRAWDSVGLIVRNDGRTVIQRTIDLRNPYSAVLAFEKETWHRVELVANNSGNWMDALVEVQAVVRGVRKLVSYPDGIQPRKAALGSTQEIRVKVTNRGTLAIDHLWLGLDVWGPDGSMVESTRTPARMEAGIDFGLQQYRGLQPGESRTFSALYTFILSSAAYRHTYRVGTYTLKYRAWEGIPGMGTPLTLAAIASLELTASSPTPQPPPGPSGLGVVMWVGRAQALVGGQPRTLDVAPRIVNGRTLVPLRFVGEALGAGVSWDGARSTAGLTRDGRLVTVQVGINQAVVDGVGVPLDVAPIIVGGRVLVPVRFIAEALGACVEYVPGEGRVTVTTPPAGGEGGVQP